MPDCDFNSLDKRVAVIETKLDDLNGEVKEIKSLVVKAIDTKADKDEVKKIKDNLEKVVWIVLIAVIGAVFTLILKV